MRKDLKYLLAYIVPTSAILGISNGGIYTFSTFILIFLFVPLIEPFIRQDSSNLSLEEVESRKSDNFYDFILFLNLPLIVTLLYVVYLKLEGSMTNLELTGSILSAGVTLGASGINVAHELGHKTEPVKKIVSRLLLIPSLYTHFTLEHNYGHHKYVATHQDPATARKGEWIYLFWARSMALCFRNAWRIEKKRLKNKSLNTFSLSNTFLTGQLAQVTYLGIIYLLLGFKGCLVYVGIAFVSIILLETINYIEHYGLVRKKLANGRYEKVGPEHSWNSNHEVGRILLYELTRHSDHHYLANKEYQILDHHDIARQLPVGYPTSMLMALFPFLWFAVMDKRLG